MARIKTKQVQGVGRITLEYAIDQFMRHNRLKNLSPRTIEYYTEDLRYFQKITEVTYLDEITDKLYEDFILHEMDKGNKMTAVNCRTRGLRVFLRFCAKREYMELIHIPMMKVDESFKDPYTDAELDKLLKRPTGDSFVEWRCWAAINTFLATGIRANTLVNIKISDVDFENDTINASYGASANTFSASRRAFVFSSLMIMLFASQISLVMMKTRCRSSWSILPRWARMYVKRSCLTAWTFWRSWRTKLLSMTCAPLRDGSSICCLQPKAYTRNWQKSTRFTTSCLRCFYRKKMASSAMAFTFMRISTKKAEPFSIS